MSPMRALLLVLMALFLGGAANEPIANNVSQIDPRGASYAGGMKCDGASDDTGAFQAAVTAAGGTGRSVVVPNTGAACMVSQINIPSNSHLIINGLLKLKPGANATMLWMLQGATNITIEGTGTLDGNRSAQTGGFSCGVNMSGMVTYLWLRNLTIQNFLICGVGIEATHAWMSNLVLINNINSSGYDVGSSDCWADHLYINTTQDEGFAFYGGVHDCGITNSTAIGSALGAGISVLNDSGQTAPSYNLLIAGNDLSANSLSGIAIETGGAGAGNHTNIVITGNRLHGNNTSNNPGDGGIKLANVTNALVANNMIDHDGGAGSSTGIYVGPNSSLVTLVGNTIWDEGQGGTVGVGIGIYAPNAIIANNLIFDDQGTKTMAFGLNGTPGTGVVLNANVILNTIGAGNNLTLNTDTISGVTCAGTPTASFAAKSGTVTHC